MTALAIVLFCVGALLAVGSATVLWQAVKLPLRGQHTTGELIRWRHAFEQQWLRSGHEFRKSTYYPIVRFEAADGSQHQVVSAIGHQTKPDWPIGHSFPVRYDPANPSDSTADPPTRAWVAPTVFLILAVVLLLAGICLWL